MAFKIGDRVIGSGKQSGVTIIGLTGTIIKNLSEDHYAVEFDNVHSQFHDCDGAGKKRYCFYVTHENLIFANKPAEPGIHFGSPFTLKVGDRVMGKGNQDGTNINGLTGTVKFVKSNGQISVEFDASSLTFHTCNGYCKPHHGFNIDPKNLKLMNITHAPTQAAAGGGISNVIVGHTHIGSDSIPAANYAGFSAGGSGGLFSGVASAGNSGIYIQPTSPQYNFHPQVQWAGGQWTSITETPAPSPYLHKEPSYAGKPQQFNAIIHNKQIDDFLLLN
jgi:hypothetical protein